MGAGLLEMKRHPRRDALFPELLDPRKVAEPGVISRFSARYHFLNGRGQIQREIHPLEKRLTDNEFVPNRGRQKKRQTLLRPLLILGRAADMDVFIAVSPIRGQTGRPNGRCVW